MFVFRRLSKEDINLPFLTGDKAFDDINRDGNLLIYYNQDEISKGEYITYLLLKENRTVSSELLGAIRYKITEIANFKKDLSGVGIPINIQAKFEQKLIEFKSKIIYLSRIGIVEKYQDMRLSKVLNILFEFIIREQRENVFIYSKFVEKLKNAIGPSYDIISKAYDELWGNYFIVSKFIRYVI